MKHRVQIAIVALLLVGACANRQAILDRTVMGLDVAHKAWHDFDVEKQARINAEAKTPEEGEQALAAWRAKKSKVPLLFAAAGATIAAALIDSDKAITDVVMIATSVIDAMTALGVFDIIKPKPAPGGAP